MSASRGIEHIEWTFLSFPILDIKIITNHIIEIMHLRESINRLVSPPHLRVSRNAPSVLELFAPSASEHLAPSIVEHLVSSLEYS